VVLHDADQVPLAQLGQRRGQRVVDGRLPAHRAQPGADVVEAERGLQALVRLAEGVQDRCVQLGAVAAGEPEHVRRDADRSHPTPPRRPVPFPGASAAADARQYIAAPDEAIPSSLDAHSIE